MSTGIATILLFVPIALWYIVTQLWLVSICFRKKRPIHARVGLVGLVVPGLFVVPLIGASRLARPSSGWAVMHYGDEMIGRAARRFPDDHDIAPETSRQVVGRTLWEKLIVAGLVVTALALVVLFSRADYVGYASITMLIQLMALSWLAEVELTAKPYSARAVPVTVPGPEPVPARH